MIIDNSGRRAAIFGAVLKPLAALSLLLALQEQTQLAQVGQLK